MTVLTTTSSQRFHGSGSTGPFTFSWRFLANADIKVYRIDDPDETDPLEARTLLTEGDDYTLTGAGTYTGGRLTLESALASGKDLLVERWTRTLQPVDIRNQGANFYPETHEEAFDNLTLMAQDNARRMGVVEDHVPAIDSAAVSTAEDAVATAADRVATGEDRVQTGLDATATAEDRVQTGLDAAATAEDAIATAADRVQTGLDATATAADRVATAADRVQTGLDVISAAKSAASALSAPGTNATSTTSLVIGTGSKVFTVQTDKDFVPGMKMMAADISAPASNWMYGTVTDYDSETGELTLESEYSNGSGTIADWVLSISGPVQLDVALLGMDGHSGLSITAAEYPGIDFSKPLHLWGILSKSETANENLLFRINDNSTALYNYRTTVLGDSYSSAAVTGQAEIILAHNINEDEIVRLDMWITPSTDSLADGNRFIGISAEVMEGNALGTTLTVKKFHGRINIPSTTPITSIDLSGFTGLDSDSRLYLSYF